MPDRRLSRALTLATVALVALPIAAPLVQANHMFLYYTRSADGEPADPGIGRVYEDDGAVASQPTGSLDGVENKVVLNATDEIGGGSLFLDSQYYTMQQTMMDANYALSPVLDGRRVLAGSGTFLAWYGWWRDFDNDSRINDFHDAGNARCPITLANCAPLDEFRWRGAAVGASLPMALYFIPSQLPANSIDNGVSRYQGIGTEPGWRPSNHFGAMYTGNNSAPDATFDDRTELSEEQQMWIAGIGWGYLWSDESTLTTAQTIVAANAARTAASTQYDLKDAEASIDVDRYEALNSDAGILFGSTLSTAFDRYRDARVLPTQIGPMVNSYVAQVSAALAQLSHTINNAEEEVIEPALGAAGNETRPYVNATLDAIGPAVRESSNVSTAVSRAIAPLWLKEPNDANDAYPGAIFSGTPGPRGLGNDYSAHASGHHLFIDARITSRVPGGANLILAPLNTGVGVYGGLASHGYEPLPCDACGPHQRGASPGFLGADVSVGLWKDENLDKWLGEVCDPEDPDTWDSAIAECSSTGLQGTNHNFGSASEVIGICGTTTLAGGGAQGSSNPGVKIRPAAGSTWEDQPGVLKIRWYDRPSYNAWYPGEMQAPTGRDEVQLELDGCTGTARGVRAIDVLLLPTGSLEISLETSVTARMTKTYKDETLGLEIAPETATDFDVYVASM